MIYRSILYTCAPICHIFEGFSYCARTYRIINVFVFPWFWSLCGRVSKVYKGAVNLAFNMAEPAKSRDTKTLQKTPLDAMKEMTLLPPCRLEVTAIRLNQVKLKINTVKVVGSFYSESSGFYKSIATIFSANFVNATFATSFLATCLCLWFFAVSVMCCVFFLSTLLKLAHPCRPISETRCPSDLGNRPICKLSKRISVFFVFPLQRFRSAPHLACWRQRSCSLFVFICCFFFLFHSAKKVLALAFLSVPEDVSCMIHYIFFAFTPLKRFSVAFALLCGRSLCGVFSWLKKAGSCLLVCRKKRFMCDSMYFLCGPLTRFCMAFFFLCVEVQIQL